MQQTCLHLEAPLCADPVAFQLGLDHARLGMAPCESLLRRAPALHSGWAAGRATFGLRSGRSSRVQRQCMTARLQAWLEGAAWDDKSLSPAALQALLPTRCPVTRQPFGGAAAGPDAPQLVRVSGCGVYTAGAVAWISRAAANPRPGELDDAATRRLAVLRALTTPMPHAQAAALPLCLLPPLGLQAANPAQRLQQWLTLELAAPGWGARLRQHAELIEDSSARLDFQLFVGALAPRALELPTASGGVVLQQALEDVWLHPRVQQRFTLCALALGEAGCAQLLSRLAQAARGRRGEQPPPHAKQAVGPNRQAARPAIQPGTAG